jgi:hypothetical protein
MRVVGRSGQEMDLPSALAKSLMRDGTVTAVADKAPASPEGDPDESWTLAHLNEYANQNNVDLGGATRKADVLDAILAAQMDAEE